MSVRPIDLVHELDAAWIVGLWSAIHGGDPCPEIVAARAVAVLAEFANGTAHRPFAFEALKGQFERLGVTVTEQTKQEAESDKARVLTMDDGEAREFRIHQYVFKFEGATNCTELPVLTHLRTAA